MALDFFFWGCTKYRSFAAAIVAVETLKTKIHTAICTINCNKRYVKERLARTRIPLTHSTSYKGALRTAIGSLIKIYTYNNTLQRIQANIYLILMV